ncbi:hypothetical protein L210DRAFT_3642851 [Boletus edulis BED1]|uniref:Uncharacterized protein n=1 Tax=Boletus edulis BED1 TaxID=1328754 RepID=A0AAD4C058_BOLED|nr:hypothetical protein L210DRAFT_3642851 [Boletus edulis BED1]
MAALWLSSPPETFPRPSLPPTLSPTPSAPILPASRLPPPAARSLRLPRPGRRPRHPQAFFLLPLAAYGAAIEHIAPVSHLFPRSLSSLGTTLAILEGLFSVDRLSPIIRIVLYVAESGRPGRRLLILPNTVYTLNTSSAARRPCSGRYLRHPQAL